MAIWIYKHQDKNPFESIVRSKECIFCMTEMQNIYSATQQWNDFSKSVLVCPVCGWWTTWEQSSNLLRVDDRKAFNLYGASAILKQMDLMNLEQPIDEVKQFLAAKYKDRYLIHPRLFEEVVADVFGNIGYKSTVTAYHNDGGIDVILQDGKKSEIGVQVKRYKNSIQVSQIREFAGALVENGMTKGIFVTTSKFQRGAFNSVENFYKTGLRIELIDSKRFYDALKLSLRDKYRDYENFIELIGDIELPTIYENYTDYR